MAFLHSLEWGVKLFVNSVGSVYIEKFVNYILVCAKRGNVVYHLKNLIVASINAGCILLAKNLSVISQCLEPSLKVEVELC